MSISERRWRRASAGFTLIELLVVVAIIGILAAVAMGQYQRSIIKARESVLRENLFTTRSMINQYFADKGHYPFDLQALVDGHYLRELPYDPVTQSRESWITVPADLGDADISTEPGIMDLNSGASGSSPIDGTSYQEW